LTKNFSFFIVPYHSGLAGKMNAKPQNIIGIIVTTGMPVISLLSRLIVGGLKLPGLIMT
jgi:hypothetical protein